MLSKKPALLLVNLGTPESPKPGDVGRYLTEFLSDPFVIDIPAPLRWLLVNVLVVPRRKHASAELYKKVWTKQGSPLMVFSRQLEEAVRQRSKAPLLVELGMRYGNPSLEKAISSLLAQGVDSLAVFPLYPQYSLAATETAIFSVNRILKEKGFIGPVSFVPPFYNHPSYLEAVAGISSPFLKKIAWDKVLFSFHGLPERQVKKTDKTGTLCCQKPDCCDRIVDANQDCYRAQSYATVRSLVGLLNLKPDQYLVGFQSRLGRTPWILPHSDQFYRDLPGQGVKRLAVISPSFVADCLETLEEIQIRGKEEFLRHGGEDLFMVPSLNGTAVWADAVVKMASPFLK